MLTTSARCVNKILLQSHQHLNSKTYQEDDHSNLIYKIILCDVIYGGAGVNE